VSLVCALLAYFQLAAKDEVKQTIRAPVGTAAFAAPSERFVPKHDPSFTETDAFHTTTVRERCVVLPPAAISPC
jgi:hypothetical protein